MTEEEDEVKKEQLVTGDTAFEALEHDFQEVLQELQGNKGLEKFKQEYEKLMKALNKSHESEKRLMQKCRELKSEIVANSVKVSTALKLSQEDQTTIASLRKELDKVWKLAETAQDKESKARDTVNSLKLEISNLTKLVEQGAGLTMGQENSVNELLTAKEVLTKERDEQFTENHRLREQLENSKVKVVKLENELNDCNAKISTLHQDIQMKNNEAQRESRKNERIERELKEMRADTEVKQDDIKTMSSQIDKLKQEIKIKEDELRNTKTALEKSQGKGQLLETRLKDTQSKVDIQTQAIKELTQENAARVLDIKNKDEEVTNFKNESLKLGKLRENAQRKLRLIEDQKGVIEQQKETLHIQMSGFEKEMEVLKRQQEEDKKAVDALTRERDILSKQLLKSSAQTQKQIGLVKLHEQSKSNLDQEIQNYKEEATKQRKIIYQLEKERDRYINEASDLTQKVLQHMEEVKAREMQIFDYKKKLAEAETRLRQQQNLYEAVRYDRNTYSKNLIESQDEITEMKRKLKIMNHQIDQLKEEISGKEAALVKENLERQRVEKERDQLNLEIQKMRSQLTDSKAYIEAQEAEERKLLKIIAEADAERLREKKELDQVISERDILGTQLVRRNDELALLYEKIKIQQSILNKGEIQYNQRLEDIRVLKLEIKKLRREKCILQKTVANVDDLRRELYHIQRELLRERTRCKALEEELENPLNVHRWRKLEGSDPSTYEMIQKIHTLQKRLISKTEEVMEKELLIQEKEKLYVELKHILTRQPGPEVAEQLILYKQHLKEKTRQMKAMAAETNMYESQVKEYKYELEKLARELQDVKKKYFMIKKKEQQQLKQHRDQQLVMRNSGGPAILPQRSEQARFTGGGFNLATKV